MSVDIFIEMLAWVPAACHTPKIEPVVPNLMSESLGSRPWARAAGAAAVSAAAETTKRRRLSMGFLPVLLVGSSLAGTPAPSLFPPFWQEAGNAVGVAS